MVQSFLIKRNRGLKNIIEIDVTLYENRISSYRTNKKLPDFHLERLIDFDNQNKIKDLSVASRANYLTNLFDFLLYFKQKRVEKLEYNDIENYILSLYERKLKTATIRGRILTVKIFLNFLGIKKLTKKLKLPKIKEKEYSLLTDSDIEKMIEGTENIMDRCIITLFAETGMRAGELRGIRIKDIQFDQHGAKIKISGKTGMRVVRIVDSVHYLIDWIKKHRYARNNESYLFYHCFSNAHTPISHAAIWQKMKNAGIRAEIKKDLNPHNFRHSRFTKICQYLTDRELKAVGGWKTTKMLDIYTHISNHEIDKAVLRKVYQINT